MKLLSPWEHLMTVRDRVSLSSPFNSNLLGLAQDCLARGEENCPSGYDKIDQPHNLPFVCWSNCHQTCRRSPLWDKHLQCFGCLCRQALTSVTVSFERNFERHGASCSFFQTCNINPVEMPAHRNIIWTSDWSQGDISFHQSMISNSWI